MAVSPYDIDRRSGVSYNTRPAARKVTPRLPKAAQLDRSAGVSYTPPRDEGSYYSNIAHNAYGRIEDRNNARALQQQLRAPLPSFSAGGSSGGGGRGFGGGGGGGGANMQAQADALMKLISSGAFRARPSALGGQIDSAAQRDLASAGGAFDALDRFLGGMTNPYQGGPQVQAPMTNPAFDALLRQQGMNPAALQAEAEMMNLGAQQSNASNAALWETLRGNAAADQSSRQLESQLGRTSTDRSIREAATGARTGVMLADEQRQRDLDAQRLQVIMELIGMAGNANINVDALLAGL